MVDIITAKNLLVTEFNEQKLISGIGIGWDEKGNRCIIINLRDDLNPDLIELIPFEYHGHKVLRKIVGEFHFSTIQI